MLFFFSFTRCAQNSRAYPRGAPFSIPLLYHKSHVRCAQKLIDKSAGRPKIYTDVAIMASVSYQIANLLEKVTIHISLKKKAFFLLILSSMYFFQANTFQSFSAPSPSLNHNLFISCFFLFSSQSAVNKSCSPL